MKPYYEESGIVIYHGDNREIIPDLGQVGAVITDPPFSERTHKGHNASANGHIGKGKDEADRLEIEYSHLDEKDVETYVKLTSEICNGWIVTMTDHTLAPLFQKYLEEKNRYVFAPLPFYSPGRSVRLSGDGPCSWTDWIIVARTSAQVRWGTLPGGYVSEPGWREREYIGGKPTALMIKLIKDYSKDEDTILDPYCGSGSTLLAAKKLGRKAIGIDISEKACEISAKRLAQRQLF